MKILLLGPPGAGKGTQAKIISSWLHIPQISTGDLLRKEIAAGTAIGKAYESKLARGQFASDDVVIEMVRQRLSRDDCRTGYLLDGFPRNINQAMSLDELGISLDIVLQIDVPDQNIIRRLSGRRVHLPSGRVYHIEFNPPLKANVDDITGQNLTQRDDDKPETVSARLGIYRDQTKPLVDHYVEKMKEAEDGSFRYESVDGVGTIDEVTTRIRDVLVAQRATLNQ